MERLRRATAGGLERGDRRAGGFLRPIRRPRSSSPASGPRWPSWPGGWPTASTRPAVPASRPSWRWPAGPGGGRARSVDLPRDHVRPARRPRSRAPPGPGRRPGHHLHRAALRARRRRRRPRPVIRTDTISPSRTRIARMQMVSRPGWPPRSRPRRTYRSTPPGSSSAANGRRRALRRFSRTIQRSSGSPDPASDRRRPMSPVGRGRHTDGDAEGLAQDPPRLAAPHGGRPRSERRHRRLLNRMGGRRPIAVPTQQRRVGHSGHGSPHHQRVGIADPRVQQFHRAVPVGPQQTGQRLGDHPAHPPPLVGCRPPQLGRLVAPPVRPHRAHRPVGGDRGARQDDRGLIARCHARRQRRPPVEPCLRARRPGPPPPGRVPRPPPRRRRRPPTAGSAAARAGRCRPAARPAARRRRPWPGRHAKGRRARRRSRPNRWAG